MGLHLSEVSKCEWSALPCFPRPGARDEKRPGEPIRLGLRVVDKPSTGVKNKMTEFMSDGVALPISGTADKVSDQGRIRTSGPAGSPKMPHAVARAVFFPGQD